MFTCPVCKTRHKDELRVCTICLTPLKNEANIKDQIWIETGTIIGIIISVLAIMIWIEMKVGISPLAEK
jgi:hypothetical protein